MKRLLVIAYPIAKDTLSLTLDSLYAAANARGLHIQILRLKKPFASDYRDRIRSEIWKFTPDIILCFGPEATQAAVALRAAGIRVIALHWFVPNWNKRLAQLGHGNLTQRVRAMRLLPLTYRRNRKEWNLHNTGKAYAGADKVISLSAIDAKRFGYAYHPMPLATRPTFQRAPRENEYLITAHTSSSGEAVALRYFAKRVALCLPNRSTVRMASASPAGEICINPLLWVEKIDLRVLEASYATCAAVIVPSPLGEEPCRTLDALRYGVPLIAHTANSRLTPELKSLHNCVLAESSREWQLAFKFSPEYLNKLATTGREEFDNVMSADHFLDRVDA